MPRLNPYGSGDHLAVQLDLDDVFGLDAHALSHSGTHHDRIVPSQLGHRFGQFLKPAVIRETAIKHGRITPVIDLDRVRIRGGRSSEILLRRYLLRGKCSSLNPSVMEGTLPEGIEVLSRMLFLPVTLHDGVSGGVTLTCQVSHELVLAFAAVERRNQGLHNTDRAVISPRVAS